MTPDFHPLSSKTQPFIKHYHFVLNTFINQSYKLFSVTVAYVLEQLDEETIAIKFSTAFCHPLDHFKKTTGVNLALERFHQNQVGITKLFLETPVQDNKISQAELDQEFISILGATEIFTPGFDIPFRFEQALSNLIDLGLVTGHTHEDLGSRLPSPIPKEWISVFGSV